MPYSESLTSHESIESIQVRAAAVPVEAAGCIQMKLMCTA